MSCTGVVIVASESSADGTADDTTGPLLRDWLNERGIAVAEPVVVPDGAPVGQALRAALASDPQVIITTGGTGVSPTDRTPEETAPLLDLVLPGIIEQIRARGAQSVPTAALSRGTAGFAGNTFVLNLPGSPSAVRDGLAVLDPLLNHLLTQRVGTGHHSHQHRRHHD